MPDRIGEETLLPAVRAIEIVIDHRYCKACDLCIKICPKSCLSAALGSRKAIVTDLASCTGCRLCELLCPDWCIDVRIGVAS